MATVRTLDAYSIHGHLAAGSPGEELLDYPSFFDALAAQGVGRSLKVGTETVGPVDYVDLGGRMAFRFISGNDAESAEAYDPSTGTTVPVELERERFIVSSAWVVVDPEARILILERKRPGVPVYQLERYLSGFGRDEGFDRLSVSLNPVPSPSFVEEILSFDRIREASITIRRPNHSFTESAREAVAQIARDSNAGSATVQVNAERKESLEKDSGIVADIVSFAKSPITPVLNAVVKGFRAGFGKERTVSLKKHQLKATATLRDADSPRQQLEAVEASAIVLIDQAKEVEEVGLEEID